MKNILIKVNYKKFVVEGDNYAGFSGFRFFDRTFYNMKDFKEFMERAAADGPEKIVVVRAETFVIKPDKFLDVEDELRQAKVRLVEGANADERRRLLDEKKRLEKRLREIG